MTLGPSFTLPIRHGKGDRMRFADKQIKKRTIRDQSPTPPPVTKFNLENESQALENICSTLLMPRLSRTPIVSTTRSSKDAFSGSADCWERPYPLKSKATLGIQRLQQQAFGASMNTVFQEHHHLRTCTETCFRGVNRVSYTTSKLNSDGVQKITRVVLHRCQALPHEALNRSLQHTWCCICSIFLSVFFFFFQRDLVKQMPFLYRWKRTTSDGFVCGQNDFASAFFAADHDTI